MWILWGGGGGKWNEQGNRKRGGHYLKWSHLISFSERNVFLKSLLSLMLMLCSNACQWQDSEVTHSKVCAKQSRAMFSFSHVESPLGNTVAVRHQSRAAGLTPKKNSTSNAVSFPLFVLVFQNWSLSVCIDSVVVHTCVCVYCVSTLKQGYWICQGLNMFLSEIWNFLP